MLDSINDFAPLYQSCYHVHVGTFRIQLIHKLNNIPSYNIVELLSCGVP